MRPPGRSLADPRVAASQRQRLALDPAATVWVQASAGTGKTKVLVDRVLALLLAGAAPQRIRCLTFTKAAAAEMKNRLLRALSDWATEPAETLNRRLFDMLDRQPTAEEQRRAAQLFARVLDAPGGLQIQTIHAFCQGLLARFPLEAGVSPRFTLIEERSAAELMAAARADLLTEAELPGRALDLRWALEQMLLAGGETSLAALCDAIVAKRAWFDRCLSRGTVGAVAVVEAAAGLAPGETRAALLANALAEPALRVEPLRALVSLLAGGSVSDQKAARAIAPLLAADPAERPTHFDDYAPGFLTGEGEPRKTVPTKKLATAAPPLAALFQDEAARLVALRSRLAAADLVEDCRALFTLAEQLLRLYDARKKAIGGLDYADLIAKTAALLADPGRAAWVLYKLDEGIDHLLIDEAQDTSAEQWQVVRQLTAEFHAGLGAHEDQDPRVRTVFAVGDGKQSIYRFQGADPAGFAAAAGHFRTRVEAVSQSFRTVPLSHSFRSVEAVLEAVDRVFALPAAQDGVVPPGESVRHAATRLGQAGRVEIWPLVQPPPLDPPEPWAPPLTRRSLLDPAVALAERIAGTLAGWFAADPAAVKPGHPAWLDSKARRATPGDVLILVRRRNALFHALARALKRVGVPVAGVDRMVLPDQTAVRDLLALGRFLLLPEDDLSLAEVLKGPLCGLDDDDLIALAAERGTGQRLWPALGVRQDLKPAYGAARLLLEGLLAEADFVPPYELFARLLGAGEGRRRWLGRLGEEAADPLDEFLAQALAYERDHPPSLQGFLAWLEQGRLEVKRDLESGGPAVRIMTVHGAKGLQAPIVFLPDTTQPATAQDSLLQDERQALVLRSSALLKAVPFAARIKAANEAATAQEYRRLFYVAMTRAEDRLYLCGHFAGRTLPEASWYALAARALADLDAGQAQALNEVLVPIERPQTAEPEAPRQPALPVPPAPTLDDVLTRPPPAEPDPPRPLAPSRPTQEDPPSLSPLAGDQGRWQRGRLLHRLLQTLPDLPPDRRAAAARRFLAQPAHGLDEATVAAWTAEILAVLALPAAAALFGPRSRAEVPVAGLVGNTRISGRLDRIAVTDDAVWLCDYKTNRPPPAAEDAVPEQYLRQLASYGALLAEIYKGKEINSFLLWTDGPRLMQISAERLAPWAP